MKWPDRRQKRVAQLLTQHGPLALENQKALKTLHRLQAVKEHAERMAYKLLDNIKAERRPGDGFERPHDYRVAVAFWRDLGWLVVEPTTGPRCARHWRVYCKHTGCRFLW